MEFDPAATDLLADLTAALDDPDLDLVAGLTELVARLQAAVPSCIGLTVLAAGPDRQVTLAFRDGGAVAVGSSLSFNVGSVSMVAYATSPGAFVDLAADVSWLTSGAATIVLDQHLSVPAPSSRYELSTASAVEQAIGALIGRGHPPTEAQRLLPAYAVRAGTDLGAAAADVLATIGSTRADDAPDAA